MDKSNKSKQNCETCFRIACRECDWVANDLEADLIQKGQLTKCPKCGWVPGTAII